jgi:hypothetical protein
MVETFTFNQAQFRRILIKHLGLAGDATVFNPHPYPVDGQPLGGVLDTGKELGAT